MQALLDLVFTGGVEHLHAACRLQGPDGERVACPLVEQGDELLVERVDCPPVLVDLQLCL